MVNLSNKFSSFNIDEEYIRSLPTTSSKIRYLYPILGTYYKTSQYLSVLMNKNIRVQHVRNVMVTPVVNPKI